MSSTYTKVTFTNRQPDTVTATKLNLLIDDLSTAIASGGGGTGTGDMSKAVYDTNNNGKVDTCDSLPWGSVTGKPSTFPPDATAMLKSVYDTNANNIVDTAESANAAPWTGITGKPSTFTPSVHAPTHRDDGSDPIPVATTSHTGSLPILSGTATTYLNGTGAFSTPAGTGLRWQGTWSSLSAYAVNDLVSFSDSTHSLTDYVCTSALTAPAGTTYNYWSTTPSSAASISPNVYANEYSFANPGQINKIGLYKGSVEAAVTSHRIGVWIKATGVNILDVTSSGEPATSGWYWYTLATPLAVNTSDHYVIGHMLQSEVVRNPGVTFPITHGPITKVNAGFQSSWGMPPMGSSTSDLGNDVEYFVAGTPNPIPPSDSSHWAQLSLGTHASTHLDNGSDPIPVATSTRTGSLPILANTATKFLRDDGTWQTVSSGTPSAHASTHNAGGSDVLAAATATTAGFVPTPPNNTTTFLRGDATFNQPSLNSLTSTAWTSVTLTLIPGSGTITTQASNAAYLVIGKTVFIHFNVSCSNIGTAAGSTTLSGLPVTPKRALVVYIREIGVNGLGFSWTIVGGGNSGQLLAAGNNAQPTWANNVNYCGTAVYEAT